MMSDMNIQSSTLNTIKMYIKLSLGVLIAILNLIEMIMIVKIRRKKKIYEVLLLSLSISDLMFGISNIVIPIAYLMHGSMFQGLIDGAYTSYLFFVLTSIFHLLFITMDSLFIVLKPLQHKVFLTRKKVYKILAFLWILAVVLSGVLKALDEYTEIFTQKKSITQTENQEIMAAEYQLLTPAPQTLPYVMEDEENFPKGLEFVLSVVIILADFIITLSYSLIIFKTRSQKEKISSNQENSHKLQVVCIAIGTTFVLFTLPYAIARFTHEKTPIWASFILVLNSGMNSIVYFFRGKASEYHRSLGKSLKQMHSNRKLALGRSKM